MSLHRRSLLHASGAALAAALPASPSLAQGGSVLRFVPHANLTVLDPVWTTAYITRNHGYMVFDTLYSLGQDLTPKPQMAAGHVISDDQRLWTISLRDGLRFHDGEKVLARDCVASIRRWASRDTFGQSLAAVIDEMTALDDTRIAIRLKRPFPLLTDALARVNGAFIMPERLAQVDAFTQLREVVGSGPYRFLPEAWNPGAGTAYARFEGYVPRDEAPDMLAGGKRAHFDRVEWRVMPDPATSAAALQSGEVDWVEAPSADLLPLLRRQRQVVVEQIELFGVITLMRPNHLQAPFNNPAFRRALWPAIDQSDAMQVVAGNDRDRWRDGVGFFTPDTSMASSAGMEALTSPRSLDAAKRAIEASGYKGERLVFLAPTDNVALDAVSHVVGDVLRRLGLNTDYAATDWGTVVQRRANRGPVEQGGWSALCTNIAAVDCATPTTHGYLRGLGANGAFGWPELPQMEAARSSWLDASDMATRRTIAEDMQRQAFRDVPFYPLGQYWQPAAYRRGLSGFVRGPLPVFWNLKKA
ncbi:ABC transporter substrate-binding protein [Roseococcus pinisoli]|uniref:ABC transporter substrate-binding protein n=1 Tax=Roseococcus pinisoli TaxID=2835040 RepID=A0ABS5QH37_9PROT|nr:ABC transporter substrate-binding protein [Roseococcus pinisoli]MBS7812904.1 ABC transporter substrate-binding protein [Roseococcus pinisoli]